MTLFAFVSSLAVFSSFVFFGVEPTRGSWCQGHRFENTWNKRVALCLGAIPLWSFLRSFSAFQGPSMIIKCHLYLPFEEHEMTITCKNKISRKCPSTSNKHVLMSASPTSQFQFQYGNLCFQSIYIYMYDRPLGLIWTPPLAFILYHPFCRTLIFSFSFQTPDPGPSETF